MLQQCSSKSVASNSNSSSRISRKITECNNSIMVLIQKMEITSMIQVIRLTIDMK
jgi:hypothetical protein